MHSGMHPEYHETVWRNVDCMALARSTNLAGLLHAGAVVLLQQRALCRLRLVGGEVVLRGGSCGSRRKRAT